MHPNDRNSSNIYHNMTTNYTTFWRIRSTFSENIQLNALTRPGYQLEAFYLEVVVGAICNLQPEIGKIGQKSFSSIIICVSQKNRYPLSARGRG